MSKRNRKAIIALTLAICLAISGAAPMTVCAAPRSKSAVESTWGWSSFRDFFKSLFGGQEKQEENFDSTPAPGVELTPLDTGDTTGLRATSYQTVAETGGDRAGTTIKYFPATLYDYVRGLTDATDYINKAGYELEGNKTSGVWENLYFHKNPDDARPGTVTYIPGYVPVYREDEIESGQTYYLVLYRNGKCLSIDSKSIVLRNSAEDAGTIKTESAMSNATPWKVTKNSDGTYTFTYESGSSSKDIYIYSKARQNGTDYVRVGSKDGYSNHIKLEFDNGYLYIKSNENENYLNQYNSGTTIGSYDKDAGGRLVLYRYDSNAIAQGTGGLPFAGWNHWTGKTNAGQNPGTGVSTNGNTSAYIYSGLVKPEYESHAIAFTKANIDLFGTENTEYKNVYTGVGIPFVYNSDSRTYTFDSDVTGAYFAEGIAQSNVNLAVSMSPSMFWSLDYGQYQTGFFPFNPQTSAARSGKTNSGQTVTGNQIGGTGSFGDDITVEDGPNKTDKDKCRTANFFFGMQATIPFNMTANGRLVANDNASDPIVFDFSGDDDVWVFIDGKLVLDLGGIHDSVSGTINFADNTITYGATNSSKASGDVANVYSDDSSDGSALPKSQGKLFNEGTESGKLGQDRASFAATTNHTLTIYYLERGAGLSNCKIQFNLPMNDLVSVKKEISSTFEDGTIVPSEIMSQVNNTRFGFTLYKKGEADAEAAPVANRAYTLYNADGTVNSTPSTDADGKFYLTNGQKASFIGDIAGTNSYYVVEDGLSDIWESPNWRYTTTIPGAQASLAADGVTSMTVSVAGNSERADELDFVCRNVLKALLALTLEVQNITIVLDYGLPVDIDLAGAITLATGGEVSEIIDLNTGQSDAQPSPEFGTLSNINNGKITYTLSRQLTDMETLHFRAVLTPENSLQQGGISKDFCVYILPATQMYYEENFGNMVTYVSRDDLGTWAPVGSSQNLKQEQGVVGTANDSPYGSDVAYLNESGDSNGTSQHVSTRGNGGALFEYTFTGIGTSIYARTTLNSGYIYIAFYNKAGQKVHDFIRDTSYKGSGTLYTIPVYTWMASEYGTYRVVVSIAKETTLSYKPNPNETNYATTNCYEFWLDGIKVFRPMNENSANASKANSAYAADAELYDSVVTLREKLLSDYTTPDENGIVWNPGNGYVVFTDTNGEIQLANEYQSNGPKEEVYLAPGQSITFSVANWDADSNFIYLGAKAPMAPGQITVGSINYTVTNTVDCYYSIKGAAVINQETGIATFTIANSGNTVISLTNIKVTGTPNFVIIDGGNNVTGEGDTEIVVDDEPGAGEVTP